MLSWFCCFYCCSDRPYLHLHAIKAEVIIVAAMVTVLLSVVGTVLARCRKVAYSC